MQKSSTEIIDGITYQATQFSASKGLRMVHRVGKILGPSLSQLSGMKQDELEADKLGAAIQALFSNCTELEFQQTVKELLEGVTRDGKPINFDIDFSGELMHLFKVLMFVFKVQFGNFFSGISVQKS